MGSAWTITSYLKHSHRTLRNVRSLGMVAIALASLGLTTAPCFLNYMVFKVLAHHFLLPMLPSLPLPAQLQPLGNPLGVLGMPLGVSLRIPLGVPPRILLAPVLELMDSSPM